MFEWPIQESAADKHLSFDSSALANGTRGSDNSRTCVVAFESRESRIPLDTSSGPCHNGQRLLRKLTDLRSNVPFDLFPGGASGAPHVPSCWSAPDAEGHAPPQVPVSSAPAFRGVRGRITTLIFLDCRSLGRTLAERS